MHFLFHTISLAPTGGSRILTNLTDYLCQKGHKVTIILDKNRVAFPLHKNVTVLLLKDFTIKTITPQNTPGEFKKRTEKKSKKNQKNKLKHKSKSFNSLHQWKRYVLKLITYPFKYYAIKKLLRSIKPDVVSSHNMYYFLEHYRFYSNENFYVALHNSPKLVFQDRTVKSFFNINNTFKNIKCLGVSDGVTNEMKELVPSISPISETLYNPFDFEIIRKKSDELIDDFYIENDYIISVSSLAKGKRVDRIINAFSKQKNNLKLVIIGIGEEESKLKALVSKLGLQEQVIFLGFIENPMPLIKNAKMLCLASESEGLPTVLIEALICGTPVISTDCPSGPSEILTGNLSRYLINTKQNEEGIVNDIASSMQDILDNDLEIDEIHINKFHKDTIVTKWESL